MTFPSLTAMELMAVGDRSLFEHHMKRIGLPIAGRRNLDPTETDVQLESISAVASIITEDVDENIGLDSYRARVKKIAEDHGYIVTIDEMIADMGDSMNDMGDAGDDASGMDQIKKPRMRIGIVHTGKYREDEETQKGLITVKISPKATVIGSYDDDLHLVPDFHNPRVTHTAQQILDAAGITGQGLCRALYLATKDLRGSKTGTPFLLKSLRYDGESRTHFTADWDELVILAQQHEL